MKTLKYFFALDCSFVLLLAITTIATAQTVTITFDASQAIPQSVPDGFGGTFNLTQATAFDPIPTFHDQGGGNFEIGGPGVLGIRDDYKIRIVHSSGLDFKVISFDLRDLNPGGASGPRHGVGNASALSAGGGSLGVFLVTEPVPTTYTTYTNTGAPSGSVTSVADVAAQRWDITVFEVLDGFAGRNIRGRMDNIVLSVPISNQPPDCSLAAIADQSADANCQATISGADVTGVTDPDGDPLTITVTPTSLVLGPNNVTVDADDGNGGTCSIDITVNVVDDTAPVPDVANLPDATGECSVTLTPPTATDNCAGSITATTTDPTTYTTQGSFSVTWTYDDGNGNTSQQTQNVIVDDVTDPVIALNGANPLTLIRFSGPYAEPGANVTDNCNPSPALAIAGTVDTNLPGSYPVTYDADDGNGNTAQVIRTVNVIDDPNALGHPYLYLADKKIMIDKMGQSDGDMHSNDEIDLKKGPATFDGDVTAVGKIDIAKNVTVDGDVTAGGELQLDPGVVITGTATEFASVSSVNLPSLSYSAGGNDVKVKKNKTKALAPGSYGKIEVEKNATLQLSTGDYFFEELIMKQGVDLEIDLATGPVTVNVVKKVDMNKNVTMSLSPLGDSDSRYVTVNSLEDMQVDMGSKLLGSFNAPYKKVHLKKDVNLVGSVCAEEIDVDKDAVALHHDSGGSLSKQSPQLIATDDEAQGQGEERTASATVPDGFALEQNYPNPFNPSTTITFAVPQAGGVTLSIYNLMGQLIRTLHSGAIAAGQHSLVWDATDSRGVKVASGVYLYKLEAQGFVATRRLILMK